jgi:hypothetical protein
MHHIHEESNMKKIATPMLVLAALVVAAVMAIGNSTDQTLPFSQNWTNTALISANNDWSAVPGIRGFLGDVTTGNVTNVDPSTLTTDVGATTTDFVFANLTINPSGQSSGGPAEFESGADLGGNPTVAMQGSGTSDAPHLILYVSSVGKQNLNLSYNLRDVDCQAAIPGGTGQSFNAQYRIGGAGTWTNLAGTYVANASDGVASQCTKVTAVSAPLPAGCNNQTDVEIRIMTTNAIGTDDEIGVDDILVTGEDIPTPANNSTWGKVKTIFRY